MSEHAEAAAINLADRPVPPITALATGAIALIAAAGVFTASHLPHHVPLAFPSVMAALAALLVLGGVVLLRQVDPFSWRTFRRVGAWSLVAYVVEMGMLEFAFLYDHIGGAQLVVVTLMLLIFTLDVALLYGFSVARFQPADA